MPKSIEVKITGDTGRCGSDFPPARIFHPEIDESARALVDVLAKLIDQDPNQICSIEIKPSRVEVTSYALDEDGSKWIKSNGYVALEDVRVFGFSYSGTRREGNGEHPDDQ